MDDQDMYDTDKSCVTIENSEDMLMYVLAVLGLPSGVTGSTVNYNKSSITSLAEQIDAYLCLKFNIDENSFFSEEYLNAIKN